MGSFENAAKKENEKSDSSISSTCTFISSARLRESSGISGPTLAISTLVCIVLGAFASLQFYLPRANSSCICPTANGLQNPIRPYNSSSIDKPKIHPDGRVEYKMAVVSDLDHQSKYDSKKETWRSFLRKGRLLYHPELEKIEAEWDEGEATSLFSQLASGGRAMELSDLVLFDGHLLTVDDRTGVVYRVDNFEDIIPWVLLNDGPGNTTKGFKGEWMTVKDQHLHVGGLGKEWTTTDGRFVNYHPMWVKVISPSGEVSHMDWTERYKKLRLAVGIQFPGYLIHESGQWSDVHKKWFFLPRRASKETYSEDRDEHMGTNLLLVADEHFTDVEVHQIGTIGDGSRGFSAFQFLPGTEDQIIVALKSEERNGKAVASYLTIFRISDGKILMADQKFDGPYKFEGIMVY